MYCHVHYLVAAEVNSHTCMRKAESTRESTWWFYDCWIIQLFREGGVRFKKVIVVYKKLSKFYKNTAFVHSRMAEFEVSVEPLSSGEQIFDTFSWSNMLTQHVCTFVVRTFCFGFSFTFFILWNEIIYRLVIVVLIQGRMTGKLVTEFWLSRLPNWRRKLNLKETKLRCSSLPWPMLCEGWKV